jgi:hypothetical protein
MATDFVNDRVVLGAATGDVPIQSKTHHRIMGANESRTQHRNMNDPNSEYSK